MFTPWIICIFYLVSNLMFCCVSFDHSALCMSSTILDYSSFILFLKPIFYWNCKYNIVANFFPKVGFRYVLTNEMFCWFLILIFFFWRGATSLSRPTCCKLTMWICIPNFLLLSVHWDIDKILLSHINLESNTCVLSNLWFLVNTYLVQLRQNCFIPTVIVDSHSCVWLSVTPWTAAC